MAERKEIDRTSFERVSGIEVRWPVVRVWIIGILVRLCSAATSPSDESYSSRNFTHLRLPY